MVKVEITSSLYEQINKTFKKESIEVFQHLKSLEISSPKGSLLGTVGGIIIKELRHSGFRFYFITDGFKLKCLNEEQLIDLLLRLVRMSDKKHQQQVIDEIKHILRTLGPQGFK